MLAPGGTEHGGGIGRWIGYLQQEWQHASLSPGLELVDTRGFGGYTVAAWHFLRSLVRLGQLRAEGRLLLVHANLAVRGSTLRKLLLAQCCNWTGTPFVLQLHSGHYFEFYRAIPRWARWLVRRMFRRADRVIALGDLWAARIVEEFGVPESSVVVMHNSVAIPTERDRRSPGAVPHILFLGRMSDHKGVPELLEALGSPALASLPWRATLAGDGDSAPYVAMAARYGIGARLVFPGWLDQQSVAALLSASDVAVLPSHYENLPVCIVEAMAYGVATIATPVGALPELLADGVSTCFVPVKDCAALAAALHRLLTDAPLRGRLAAAGHEVFRSRLTIAHQAKRLHGLYKEVLAERSRS